MRKITNFVIVAALRSVCVSAVVLVVVFGVFAQSTGVDRTFDAVPSTAITGNGVSQFVVQSDGKVIVFGPRLVSNGVAKGDLVRLNTDGSVDTTFNYCGCAEISYDNIRLAPGGKLMLGGVGPSFARIVRLNSDGSIDQGFNTPNNHPNSLFTVEEVQADGKVFATKRYSQFGFVSFTLFRFNSDGSQDSGFAPITYASGSPVFGYVRLALLGDGKFYMATTAGNTGSSVQLTKRNIDGTIDSTWEAPSISTAGFPQQTSINDIAVQADGSILIAGRWDTVNGTTKQHLVKLFSAGNVDTQFTGPTVLSGFNVKVLPDGKILFGAGVDISGISKIFRLNANGSNDASYTLDASIDGQWWYQSSINNAQIAVQFGISSDIPMPGDFDADGLADYAIFRPSNNTW